MADIRQKAVATANTYDQGDIAGLDATMTRRLIASTVLTESHGGDLAVTNKQGYVGRYQAGAGWLADAGYVDADKLKASMAGYKNEWAWAQAGGMTQFLENPSNWKNGLSLDKYKASDDLQDRAFKINCDKTYARAVKEGVLHADDSPEKVAGFLKARHISGYNGAVAAATGGRVYSDSNGTSNYDYMHDITRNRDGLNQYMSSRDKTQSPSFIAEQPQSQSGSTSDTLLLKGERGDGVKQLQEALNKAGIRDAEGKPLPTTGNFGDMTEAAVRKYQEQKGLEVDGKAGKDTLTALGIYPGQQQTPPAGNVAEKQPSAEPSKTSPSGSYGERTEEAVRKYQEQVGPGQGGNAGKQPSAEPANTPPSGSYGERTEEAVRKYQEQAPATNANDKPLISNPSHPDNKLYQQAVSNLEQLGPSGGFKSREELEKAAAAVAVDAKTTGLQSIDHISKTSAPNGQTYLVAVQGDPTSAAAKNSYIDYGQAVNQTVDQSTKMAQQLQQAQKSPSEEAPTLDSPARGKMV